MWTTKHFKTNVAMNSWMVRNWHRYQITVLYVNNGYAVEYRKLRLVY